MNKTITIPLDPSYSYELPTRICLVCEKLEREGAVVANTSEAWLCDKCKNTLLKLIKENEDE